MFARALSLKLNAQRPHSPHQPIATFATLTTATTVAQCSGQCPIRPVLT